MQERHIVATGIAVVILAAVHLLSGKVKETREGNRFASFAAGLALSYVFMHVLPELAEYQSNLLGIIRHRLTSWFTDQVYLFALVGVIFFYMLRGVAARKNDAAGGARDGFRLDLYASSFHAALAGYLFAFRTALGWPLLLITGAFGAHYWSSDLVLLERYGERYRRTGAAILAAVIIAGWIVGQLAPVPRADLTAIYAFLSGGIIMDSLHGELPQEEKGDFAALFLGAASYTGLILWIYYLASREGI